MIEACTVEFVNGGGRRGTTDTYSSLHLKQSLLVLIPGSTSRTSNLFTAAARWIDVWVLFIDSPTTGDIDLKVWWSMAPPVDRNHPPHQSCLGYG